MAVPRSNGEHIVIDCAMSQFSYGKMEDCRLKGKELPVPGGYDSQGNLTTAPGAIEHGGRVLPMGYWKGSGISIVLDLIGTVLANGNSVQKVGTFENETGLTQIMIAIDSSKVNSTELTDRIVTEIVEDIKHSVPETEGGEVFYPGENSLKSMRENRKNGIPVVEEKWNLVLEM